MLHGAMVQWSDGADAVIRGDITAAAAYITPAGGAVAVGVAPCGLADRARGTLGFTTSLGFGKKLERIVRDPHVAVAYHARDHGFSASPRYVLAQGIASVDLDPSPARLEEFTPQAVRHGFWVSMRTFAARGKTVSARPAGTASCASRRSGCRPTSGPRSSPATPWRCSASRCSTAPG
ncbi:MAG TPA: hypothetical protein VJ622_04555 [Acidimicrobiia bacterium]|nr:hypothetical protein [Acidimicrobiia bacterium]